MKKLKSFLKITSFIVFFLNISNGNVENSCFTEHGYYLCHDNSKCLKDNLVCDGTPHCNDKSDEGEKCDIACGDSNLPCTQECFKTPSGPKCKCNAGYQLQHDKHTCQDINECELETQVCDHFCENTNGSYKCSCAENYRLLEGPNDDNATCRTAEFIEPAMLLFSVGYEIYGKILDKTEKWIVTKAVRDDILSIAFDPKFEKVYWITDRKRLYMTNLKDNEGLAPFILQGLDNPENLAVDWLGRNIYITEYKKSEILVCNLEIEDCFVLVKNLFQPRSLQLDLEERYLYYTTITPNKIVKAGLDGKDSRVIIRENIVLPKGLALDYPAKRIFWVDAYLNKIESSNYEGKDRKGFPIKDVSHAYSLAVWQDRIYWTGLQNDSKKEIHSCRKRDGMTLESEFKDERMEVRNIMIYHTSMFKNIHNPCEENLRKKCSHICLLSPTNPNGYVCACPKDMKLRSDNHFCEDFGDFALVSVLSNIYRVPLKYYTNLLTTPEILLAFNNSNIADMDYNPLNDEIYFADSENECISKVSLKNGKVQKVIENIRFPTSVAVDWLRDNLYWINGVHHVIEVSRTSGSYRKIIADDIQTPTHIGLDVTKGYIYVSDNSYFPTIHKCELNGSYCQPLVHSSISQITSFHVDTTSEPRKFYWANAHKKIIESVDEYGRNRALESATYLSHHRVTENKDYIILIHEGTGITFYSWKDFPGNGRYNVLDISDVPRKSKFMDLSPVYSKFNNTKSPCFSNERKCDQFCFSQNDLKMVCGCSQRLTLLSDGTSCSTQRCSSTEWMCDNGECISNFTRCDGSVDCSDESDEKNCTVICSEEEFQCKDGSCITKKFKCDGFRDCRDNSDEENCTKANKEDCTGSKTWQCGSEEFIPYFWRCDGRVQCTDGSDEKNCDKIVCQEDKMKWIDGTCIPSSLWCDGDKDCNNGEDEINCRKTWQCGSGEFIPYFWRCNDRVQCTDGSDEKNCDKIVCQENKMKCSEGTCIPSSWWCDGDKDCFNGEDEINCRINIIYWIKISKF